MRILVLYYSSDAKKMSTLLVIASGSSVFYYFYGARPPKIPEDALIQIKLVSSVFTHEIGRKSFLF